MLSGNGRHRRPRQAPALVVAAGVTGSAIAIPLLAAGSASAASTATWDKLAECESGGQWSLDAGNGYYGGLQFSQEMWEQYGGLDFAPRADEASRSQQIAVAEKALAAKGPSAWPSCSIVAGLTQGDDTAEVDPGASASPRPSGSADAKDSQNPEDSGDSTAPAESAGEKNHAGSATADPSGAGDASDPAGPSGSADPSSSADTADGSGTSDASGDAGDEPGAAASDEVTDGTDGSDGGLGAADTTDNAEKEGGAQGSASADPSDPAADPSAAGRHRGDRASDDASASRQGEGRHASREEQRADGAYTVRSGDNLWDIADAHDVRGGWDALYDLNKKTVGSDPDLILPGQSLDLGLESGEK
ncbi:transglycosylase family protein [Streptomyces sp. NPDC049813]|uniref:transglycosylase family protein n=1 Tax=Streptomyces sp. NPDC049813 TaxID=3365597 RepID=UPI0037B04DCB